MKQKICTAIVIAFILVSCIVSFLGLMYFMPDSWAGNIWLGILWLILSTAATFGLEYGMLFVFHNARIYD